MPEDEDYRVFFGMLDHPERWTDRHRATVGFVLLEQRDAVAQANPSDHRGRARLQRVVERIERAIAVHDQSSSG